MASAIEIPRQKIPESEKDEEWKKDTIEAIISSSRFGESIRGSSDKLMEKWYKIYNGQIDDSDYTHVTRPYGEERRNFPAKIHNYPIIPPRINLLKGEKRNRPFNYSVVVENADVSTRKTREKKKKVKKALKQEFIDELERNGQDVGPLSSGSRREPASSKGKSLRQFVESLEDEYRDRRARVGQKSLNYIENKLEVKDKQVEAWFHFLVGGIAATEKGVKGGELFYDVLNPLNIDYSKAPDSNFIEDGEWAVVRKLVNAADVIDEFHEELTDEEIHEIEQPDETTSEVSNTTVIFQDSTVNEPVGEKRERLVEVVRVYWKSMKKVGILTYKDRLGQEQKKIVDSDYEEGENEEVKWRWVNQVWKGYRINGDIYKEMEPMEVQRGSIDNPSKCKLPINGRAYSNTNAENISLVGMVYPYQLTYNIYKFRLENAIAKSKGVIAQFDIEAIPGDWDIEEWLYYIDSVGISFVNYSEEGMATNPQQQQVMDMTVKVIEQYISLLQHIESEVDSLLGISPQRKGMVGEYEGKGNVEQSISRSFNITKDIFAKFSRFEERDLQGLLDFSKKAWRNGKQASYIMTGGDQEILEVEGPKHRMTEYGVFVSDAGKDTEKLDFAQQISQAMIQNGYPASSALEVIDQDSFETMKQKVKKIEEQEKKLRQQQQKAEKQLKMKELQLEEKKIQAGLTEERISGEYDLEEERIQQGNKAVEGEKDRELERERIKLEERELEEGSGNKKEPANG